MSDTVIADAEYRSLLSSVLTGLGISPGLSGYSYIISAVIIYKDMISQKHIVKVTKDVYPTIADEYGTTPSCVERSIRHTVGASLKRGNVELLKSIFGPTVTAEGRKLTNSEFIAALTYWMEYKNKDLGSL